MIQEHKETCPECGAPVRKCRKCGDTEYDRPEGIVTTLDRCPDCGAPVKFCKHCGKPEYCPPDSSVLVGQPTLEINRPGTAVPPTPLHDVFIGAGEVIPPKTEFWCGCKTSPITPATRFM